MRTPVTRRRVLAGMSVLGLPALAGCPSGDGGTASPPGTSTSTATSTPTSTATPSPVPDQLVIPAGETHTIDAGTVESYVSVEWDDGAGLVLEPDGALELTTTA